MRCPFGAIFGLMHRGKVNPHSITLSARNRIEVGRSDARAHVSSGSNSEVPTRNREVGFAFKNGHRQSGLPGPFCAISRLMHRSKANPIRSLRPRGASTDAGRSRPSALAVFRLTTSSSAPADQPASLRPLSAQSWAMQERPQRQRPLRPKLRRSCRAVLAGASASVKSDAKCPRCLALHFWI